MMPFSFWRVGLALLVTIAAFVLSRPVIEVLLHTIRSRLDKHVLYESLSMSSSRTETTPSSR